MSARRVLLMCDYGAEPVWSADGSHSLGVEALPLGAETRSALLEWAATYDSLASTGYRWPSRAAREEFDARGRALAERVQRELGGAWEVGYFSELEGRKIWPSTAPS